MEVRVHLKCYGVGNQALTRTVQGKVLCLQLGQAYILLWQKMKEQLYVSYFPKQSLVLSCCNGACSFRVFFSDGAGDEPRASILPLNHRHSAASVSLDV